MAKRWVEFLVALYPADFRSGYGRFLVETFEDQWEATPGPIRRAGLWVRTTGRLLAGAGVEWWETVSTDGGGGGMGQWFAELRHGVRRLLRAPGFTTVAVGTIGIASGAFGAVYGVVSDVVLEEMPFEEPGELVWIWRDYWGSFPRGWLSGYDIDLLRRHEVFAGVMGVRTGRMNLSDASGTNATDVRTLLGSPGYLDLLGVAPVIGSGFSEVAETGTWEDRHPEVVLRHSLWTEAFGGDPRVLGQDIFLNGESYTVVGVMPPDFDLRQGSSLGTPMDADAYLTLPLDLATEDVYNGSFAALARVRSDAPPGALDQALRTASAEIDTHFRSRGLRLWTIGLREDLIGDVRRPLFAVLGAGGLLLLILGMNLATLMLSRSSEQASSVAVRAALGATPGSRFRTALAEPFVVAVGGALLGALLAKGGTDFLRGFVAESVPRAVEIGFEVDSIAAVLLGALAIATLGAIGPVARWTVVRPLAGMAEGGRGGRSRAAERARAGFVVAQVGMALTLVVGAGLLFRTVQGLVRQDPGFDAGPALTFRVGVEGATYHTDPSIVEAQSAILDGLRAIPGVEVAGYANSLPLSQSTNQFQLNFPDHPTIDGEQGELIDAFVTSPGYAEALGMRVLAGRAFADGDAVSTAEGTLVQGVLIDDVLAARWFPDGDAVGGRVALFVADTLPILGVVDQPRLYSVAEDDRGQLFLPAPMRVQTSTRFVVRVRPGLDPTSLLPEVRRIVAARDASLAVSEVETLDGLIQASLGSQRLNLRLAAVFALSALLLAGLGIYGVASTVVLQRRREIGLRMAIGAEPGRVVRSVVGVGVRLVVAGAVVGLVSSWAAGRWIASFLYGVEPLDPPTLVAAAVALVLTSIVAALIPARRATRIPPAEALRAE